MRYNESSSQTAELLRLVLPRLAQHGGHYAPTTYTVWYEHVSGMNPGLSQALEQRLKDQTPVQPAEFERLYTRHIHGRDTAAIERLQEGLTLLLKRLAETAGSSGEGAAEFARALSECEHDLGAATDPESVGRVIQALVTSTSTARARSEALSAEVASSRAEMQALREHLDTLQSEALTDPLTGLLNRRGLQREMDRLYGEQPEALAHAAVLIADIDHFKKVNDSYGHLFGDQVIRAAAQALEQAVKGRDLIARFGGEEFLILLPDTPPAGAQTLAEQVRMSFSKVRIRRSGSKELMEQVTISVGVTMPAAGEAFDLALERADKALYLAKNAGRNRVRMLAADGTEMNALNPEAVRRSAGAH